MKRALIVDDSSSMRRIISRTAKLAGVTEIDEAPDGESAIRLYKTGKYHIVITDWHMAQVSGLDVVHAIRKQDADVPIMMVTVESGKEQVMQAIQAGVADYLSKPFTADVLKAKLHKLLK